MWFGFVNRSVFLASFDVIMTLGLFLSLSRFLSQIPDFGVVSWLGADLSYWWGSSSSDGT